MSVPGDSISHLTRERDAWRKLAIARGEILVAYRIGGRPPGKHIDDARAATTALRDMGFEI